MKNFFNEFYDGSPSRNKKKKLTVTVIFVTTAAILLSMLLLIGSFVVSAIKDAQYRKDLEESAAENDAATNAYTTLTVEKDDIHKGNLLLVNKDTEFVFGNSESELVAVHSSEGRVYKPRDNTLMANSTALAAFNTMMKDVYANVDGASIVVRSAYRSAKDQEASSSSTPVGYSDFHTGMLFELKDDSNSGNYENINSAALKGKYDWLYKNAHKYGFIVRYPDDISEESTGKNAGKNFSSITGVEDFAYTFRYVGVAHATYIYNNELCLEEYFELLRSTYNSETPLSVKGADGKSYEIYYCASSGDTTEISVPAKYVYEISGDNMNGYIITVCKSKSVKK